MISFGEVKIVLTQSFVFEEVKEKIHNNVKYLLVDTMEVHQLKDEEVAAEVAQIQPLQSPSDLAYQSF